MLPAVDLHGTDPYADDDAPTRIRWHGPTWDDAVAETVDDPKTRIFDVASELIPRATRRVRLGGLIVVVEPGPELQAPARAAAESLGLAPIEIDLDAAAEFVALWKPVVVVVPERHYGALIERLGRRGIALPILRVGVEATRRPDLAARLKTMIVDRTPRAAAADQVG